MLIIFINRRKKQDFEQLEDNFEQQLLIHRPEAYKKYMEQKEEQKEDNFGYDEIVWRAPESMEEFREVNQAVSEAYQQTQIIQDDEEFQRELEMLQQFKDINLSLIKDEDGPTV